MMHPSSRVGAIAAAIVCLALSANAAESPDETFHQAMQLWLAGRSSDAMIVLERAVKPPRGKSEYARFENARLLNLAAWIERDRSAAVAGARMPNMDRSTTLKNAEVYAARAAYESPLDVRYWSDLVQIAAERRTPDALDRDLENGAIYSYTWHDGQTTELFAKEGERALALAIRAEQRGDSAKAETDLEAFLNSPGHEDACVPRIALAEMEFASDRFASAAETLQALPKRCGIPPSVARLAVPLAGLRELGDASSPNALATWNRTEPHSWELLQFVMIHGAGTTKEQAKENLQRHYSELELAVLRDPLNADMWEFLWEVAITKKALLGNYNRVLVVVNRRTELATHPVVRMASVYPLLYNSKLEKTRSILRELVAASPYDARSAVALALVSGALHDPAPNAREVARRLTVIAPTIAPWIDTTILSDCFVDAQCAAAGIVCREPTDVLLKTFDIGISHRKDINWVPEIKHVAAQTRDDLANMIRESEGRVIGLLASFSRRQDRFERTVDAELAAIRARGEDEREARRALAARLRQIEQRAREVERDMLAAKQLLGATRQELASASMRIAVDEDILQRMPEKFELVLQNDRGPIQEALTDLGKRIDVLVARVRPHLEHASPDLLAAVDVWRHPTAATGRDLWKASVVILNRFGVGLNLGTGSEAMQLQMNLIAAIDAIADLVLRSQNTPRNG
jgi:hypothetical protein